MDDLRSIDTICRVCQDRRMSWAGGDVIALLDLLRENGLVALVKADGQRSSNPWTVLVTGPPLGDDHIRVDHHDIGQALDQVVERLQQRMADSFPSADAGLPPGRAGST